MASQQSSSSLLMVRPVTFGFDQETAASNVFQHESPLSTDTVRSHVLAEFDEAVNTLEDHDIAITVFEDSDPLEKPDAVFPNNWLSMWPDGHVYLYPMAAESRRKERSREALRLLKQRYEITEVTDLSFHESDDEFLESTGVMIFDHNAKIVYGCLSVRCDEELFRSHAAELGYTPVVFHAFDSRGIPIYHTNVLMGVQSTTAVICLEVITDIEERGKVVENLKNTGHEIIEITEAQMRAFCGNVLEIRNEQGHLFLALSQTAYDAFTPEQRERLSKDKTLLPLSVPIIESIGGGSVRCMLAEVFLPRRNS